MKRILPVFALLAIFIANTPRISAQRHAAIPQQLNKTNGMAGTLTTFPASPEESPFERIKGKKEDRSRRDAYSRHYINNDGSYTALIGSGPVHYEKNGVFEDIECTVVSNPSAEYPYANTTNILESYFGATAHTGVKNKAAGNDMREFLNTGMYWETNGQVSGRMNSSDVPVSISGNKASYPNLYGSISAVFTIETGRRKLNYIIPDFEALGTIPFGAGYLVFTEDIELPDGWTYTVDAPKGILLNNPSGTAVFNYEHPVSVDASGLPEREINTLMEVRLNGNILTACTKVKVSWLLEPDRQFPLMVDPTINVFPNSATNWTGWVWSDGFNGIQNNNMTVGRSGGFWAAGFARFNLSSIANGSTINTATGYINITAGSGTNITTSTWALTNCMDPLSAPSAVALYNSMTTAYSATTQVCCLGSRSSLFAPVGRTAIQNALSNGFIALGVYPMGTWTNGATFNVSGHTAAAQISSPHRPYLAIDYTPAASCYGGTASGPAYVPTNNTAALTLSGHSGTAIQWESSPNGSSGWANVSGGSGATTISYTTPSLADGTYYYRARVSDGACTDYSNTVTVFVAANPIYCNGAGSGNAFLNNHIEDVIFHEWSDPNPGYYTNNYLNYSDTTTYGYATVVAGQYHHFAATIRSNGSGTASTTVAAWIDFNNDGIFDNTPFSSGGERIDIQNFTSTVGNTYAAYLTIPGSISGTRRVRIRALRGNFVSGGIDPCGVYTNSQTKDFTIKVLPSIGSQPCGTVNGNANVVLANSTSDKVYISRVKVDGPDGNVLDNSGMFFGVQAGTTITMYNYSNLMGSFSNGLVFEAGENYTVEVEHSGYYSAVGVFIDWNGDGDFTDTDELIGRTASSTLNPYSFSFTVPTWITDGQQVVMRVRLRYDGSLTYGSTIHGCNSIAADGLQQYSEIEDYRVTLSVPVLDCAEPANLGAAIGEPANGTEHHLTVSWEPVTGATAYEIEYSTDGLSWNTLSTNHTAVTYDHNTGDSPNAPYYYRVRAKDNSTTCTETAVMTIPVYTAADVPNLLITGNETQTTLDITLQAETPVANPSITTYSLYSPATQQYVQTDGTLGNTEVFQTAAQWGTITVAGLTAETEYCFYAKARNNDGDIRSGETMYAPAWGPGGVEDFDSYSWYSYCGTSITTLDNWMPCVGGNGTSWSQTTTNGCGGSNAVQYSTSIANAAGLLRSPRFDASGQNTVTVRFDITNSHHPSHTADHVYVFIGTWSYSGGFYNSYSDPNAPPYQYVYFDQVRNCQQIELTFDVSAMNAAFKSNMTVGFWTIGTSTAHTFNVVVDNFSVRATAPATCETTLVCTHNTWTGIVSANWHTAGNWTCGTIPVSTTDVTIPEVAVENDYPEIYAGTAYSRDLTIAAVASVTTTPGYTLEIHGDLTNNGTAALGNGLVVFPGNGKQTIGGNSISTFANLEVNNSTPGISLELAQDIVVNDELTITDGMVDLNGFDIDLGSDGVLIGESETDRITGTSGEIKALIDLNNTSQAYLNIAGLGVDITTGPVAPGLTTVSRGHYTYAFETGNHGISRYFRIEPQSNSDLDATLRIYYFDAELAPGVHDKSKLIPWRSADQGQTWEGQFSPAQLSNDVVNNWVQKTAISQFSTWTLSDWEDQPLPVELLYFSASLYGTVVKLEWATATEVNNHYFTVERSEDAVLFSPVLTRRGAGNSVMPLFYTDIDLNPLKGYSYYRLKQTDYDGAVSFSAIIPVRFDSEDRSINALVDPGRNILLRYEGYQHENIVVTLHDLSGRTVSCKEFAAGKGENFFTMANPGLTGGVYILRVTTPGKHWSKKLIIPE